MAAVTVAWQPGAYPPVAYGPCFPIFLLRVAAAAHWQGRRGERPGPQIRVCIGPGLIRLGGTFVLRSGGARPTLCASFSLPVAPHALPALTSARSASVYIRTVHLPGSTRRHRHVTKKFIPRGALALEMEVTFCCALDPGKGSRPLCLRP